MDNKEYFQELFETIEPKLQFPKDAGVEDAWKVYEPSFFTQYLSSELNRNIYAEAFEFNADKAVLSLKMLVLQHLLAEYKGGAMDEKVMLNDKIWMGERIDIELPIKDTVDLDNETYWKRVALKKCKNSVRLSEALRLKYYTWKNIAIESKMVELFETTKKTSWNEETINAIARASSPYVFRLEVGQLQAIDDMFLEKNRYNYLYKIFNYPPKDCHHGNFGAAVGELTNLVSLTLQFAHEKLVYNYHKRYFEMSYEDIESLAKGLSRLHNLQYLCLNNNRLDDRKCKILVRGFVHCPLQTINMGHCHLGDNACKALAYYIIHGENTLTSLELCGNLIGRIGWQAIGFALQSYAGELEYLGMSANPVSEGGVVAIGGGICGQAQIKRLDMSRIEIDNEGPFRVVQIVGFHKRLKWLNLTGVCLGGYLGDKLVEMLQEHWNLEYLAVKYCGLSENQERKLKILLERNTFYLKNPCMKKDWFTETDAQQIDEWIVKLKNPQHIQVLQRQAKQKWCEYEPTAKVPGTQIPSFIPASQRVIPTNSELLDTYYIDCFGTDSDMYLYDPKQHNEKTEEGLSSSDEDEFKYNPNEHTEERFLDEVLMGKHVNFTCPQYFK